MARLTRRSMGDSPRYSWIVLLVFAVAGFGMTGCESPSMALDSDGENGEAGIGDFESGELVPPTGTVRAYHILQHADITGSGWPNRFKQYKVFVCNATLPEHLIEKIRRDLPGSICLAAVSAQDAALGVHPLNPYWVEFEAAFDPSLCITDLDTGLPIPLYGIDPDDPTAGYSAFVMSQEAADVLAAFHRDRTMQAGYDGLYIDMCNVRWPRWKTALLESVSQRWDIDNDGVADDLEDLHRQYRTWRPYFTQQLRSLLGDRAVLLANTDGILNDAAISGITLERVGDRFSVNTARWYLLHQLVTSARPQFSVVWAMTEESERPSINMVTEHPWVYYGTVR